MTRRTNLVSMLGLGSALLLSSAVYAQPPGGPGAPGGAPGAAPGGAPGAPADTGVVTNTDTLIQQQSTSSGPMLEEDSTLPNTGGAPWLMALAGSATAGSALLLRRKLS